MDLEKLINDFFVFAIANNIEIYNEFSLQHELGIYLRGELSNYKIQFERNISYFGQIEGAVKKEIDIVVFNPSKTEKYAIELKYPVNGQYPEQMYSFVKDIKFMETLKNNGYNNTFAVVLVKDKPFYEGKNKLGIYKAFRESFTVSGNVHKPTGNLKNVEYIQLEKTHKLVWRDCLINHKYYCIKI